jgi:hypothetical protein
VTTSGSVTSPVLGLGVMVRRCWKDPAPSAVQTQDPKTKVSPRLKAAKQALELREHRATHRPDATLGPYGPYRDWLPKTSDDAVDQGIPRAPVREAPGVEGGLVDL